ncbi:LysR substrate-binding domain-containing protein [Micromonospora sp. B11E3]|uniref:LysR family transcriptional regulator n=1 Tax=Micromonospora sp. B11E3 TaxID=3153562 RepID=UPI00325CEC9C
MNVTLRHLRCFVAVAETLSFTRAAERLHIAQPSLSYTIRQLEHHLGLMLLERTTRATVLTREGVAFLAEARAVLDRFEEAMATASRIAQGQAGRLRLGYLIGAAVEYVPVILQAFTEQHPDVKIEVIEYDFSAPNGGLDTGDTDVAIVRPPLHGVRDVTTRTLLAERCFACVPARHTLAARSEVDVHELLAEPIVAAPGEGTWRDYWILDAYRTEPATVVHEAATFEAELQAIAFGRGISIVPETAPRLYARPGVVFVPITGMPSCEVAVAHRAGAPPAAAAFAQVALDVVDGRRYRKRLELP